MDTTEHLFSLVANSRRRTVLQYLRSLDTETATLSELVDHVVASEPEGESEREVLKIELHHVHLPKLADGKLLEYDARSNTVRYHGNDILPEVLVEAPEANR